MNIREESELKCEVCKQRSATLHLTNYINGQKAEVNLCRVCAVEHGYIENEEEAYTIHDLLSGFFNVYPNLTTTTDVNERKRHELHCPECQMTYQQFSRSGKFGCSQCYEVFNEYLNPIFKRVHGGTTKHVGKIPKRQYVYLEHKRQVHKLREHLKKLINEERFEEAAELRDKIKEMEQGDKIAKRKGDDA